MTKPDWSHLAYNTPDKKKKNAKRSSMPQCAKNILFKKCLLYKRHRFKLKASKIYSGILLAGDLVTGA